MEIKPSLHETEFKNCFGIYSKTQNLKFDKKFYDKLVELNFFVKEDNEDEKLTRFLKNDSISFKLAICYNNTSYDVNPKVYEYLYNEIDSKMSTIFNSNIEIFNVEINLKLECYSDINKKIDLLESTNVNITNSIVNPIDFVTFIEENPTSIMNFGSWKEYIIHTLSYENKIILDFLLGKKIDISKLEIWDDWKNIYLIYSKKEIIKQKIKEIKKSTLSSKHSLFKDNAEAFIEYIVNNTDKKINTGFYTYLFYFLKKEKLINSHNQTSDIEYIKYVKENYLIKSSLKFTRFNPITNKEINSTYSETLIYFKDEYIKFMNKI